MSPTPYRAVIFDLDGTLVDSAPDIHAAVNAMLADIGRPALALPTVVGFIGDGVARLVARVLDAGGGATPDLAAAARARFDAHYHATPAGLTRIYPGVTDALDALVGAGLPLGICTNKPEPLAKAVLADLGLDGFFGAVVGGDPARALKPDPEGLHLCLGRLGAGVDACLYVGDSEVDAATAAAAGAPFALFAGGYRRGPAEAIAADCVFDGYPELVRFALRQS